jgi:hypothetical protein
MKPLARRSQYRTSWRVDASHYREEIGRRNARAGWESECRAEWRVGERALGPVEPPRVSFRRDTMNRPRPILGGAPCADL